MDLHESFDVSNASAWALSSSRRGSVALLFVIYLLIACGNQLVPASKSVHDME